MKPFLLVGSPNAQLGSPKLNGNQNSLDFPSLNGGKIQADANVAGNFFEGFRSKKWCMKFGLV